VILSPDQLRSLAASVGFPDPAMAAAVAMAESCGNTCAQGDPNIDGPPCYNTHPCTPNGTSSSFGLWQIHKTPTIHTQYDATLLLQDKTYNARAAFEVYTLAGGWTPWSTFTNGSYRQYLPAGYAPPAPAGPSLQPLIRPPARRPDSTGLAMVGALAVAAAAGYAALREWRTQS
jgi:hypothetical protein